MRSVFLGVVIVYLLALGFSNPFVAAIAYLWIDIVKPQSLAYSAVITSLPLSLISGVVVIVAYAMSKKGDSFRFSPVQWLIMTFAVWITFTTYIADPMLEPWVKWDPSFKALVFTVLIPLLFRSRLQLEALFITLIFSLATIVFSAGVKTLMGGGGYGTLAVLGGANSGMAESSTLSAVALMMLPLIHFVYQRSIILPNSRMFKLLLLAVGVTAIAAVVGSTARTGLVAGAFLLFFYLLRSQYKFVWAIILTIMIGIGSTLELEGSSWGQRMTTINSYDEDASATGRIDVWKWTLKFVAQHPLGGGFDAYRFNGIATPGGQTNASLSRPTVVGGKAFHSIYFEVLGEQGFFGFFLYFSVMLLTFFKLNKIRRFTKNKPELEWANDLAAKMFDAQAVLMVAGLFIGIAYQPVMFYLVAATICLSNVVLKKTAPTWNVRNDAKKYSAA